MSAKTPPVRLFIGSSAEGKSVAHNLQSVLESRGVCEVVVWDQGVFLPSDYAIDALVRVAGECDFAVLVASADDVTRSRDTEQPSVRDNVVLEYGLFTGALGRKRTFLLVTGGRDTKLPTDTMGLMRLPYRNDRSDQNEAAAVNDAALQIKQRVDEQGRLDRQSPVAAQGAAASRAPLDAEIALLRSNAVAQGWTVKESVTALRLKSPRGHTRTLPKGRPEETRERLRKFANDLRAHGLRVSIALRQPVEMSPFS